ncbi:sensor histidine kinase [Sporomusa aerivorans]|uniref:sensor histidine kinase n=1 Tax=Sporomusa aerivorans TaxID=204936 RepID=UPI00352A64C1
MFKPEDRQDSYKPANRRLQAKIRRLHGDYHRGQFLRHYRYFRYLRPLGLLFNLTILYLLFRLTDNRDIVLFFTGLIVVKELLHFFFLLRLEKKLFRPMISLKKGLDEVTNGNYSVKVENNIPNDLAVVIDSFNEMTEKLYENEKLKAEYEENRKALITNISHDLKTPITAIQGYVEALCDDSVSLADTRNKYLQTIHHNVIYVNNLIDDLFLFAKLDMQKLDFQYRVTPIRTFMDDLMEEYKFDFTERNIEFCYNTQIQPGVLVNLDGKRFHQAINNIINNAIQHGPAAGLSIQVSLYRQDELVCIDIHDNGTGIPEEKLAFVFDRFYRIHTERPKEMSGTGLGLSIAKELIEAHQGRITVASSINTGTCFTIRLPVWQDEQEENCHGTNSDY